MDGCYRINFPYHCGRRFGESICRVAAGWSTLASSRQSRRPSELTSAGSVISFIEDPSDVATPAVPLAASPKLQLMSNFENTLIDTLGIAVFLMVPYSLKQSADFAEVLGVLQLNKCNVDINSLEEASCDFNVENATSVLSERVDQQLKGEQEGSDVFYNEEVVPRRSVSFRQATPWEIRVQKI